MPLRDIICNRITENFSLESPLLDNIFAQGDQRSLEVVDIFANEWGPLTALEIAFAFRADGFHAIEVHMLDIPDGFSLDGFCGLAACGGFSCGDVLGAGQEWAKFILMHCTSRKTFEAFFKRPDAFSFGGCNGCQMLTRLKELIPGAEH